MIADVHRARQRDRATTREGHRKSVDRQGRHLCCSHIDLRLTEAGAEILELDLPASGRGVDDDPTLFDQTCRDSGLHQAANAVSAHLGEGAVGVGERHLQFRAV